MPDDNYKKLEDRLETKKVEHGIAEQNKEIAELKAAESEAKKKYGPDWRKVLGLVGKMGMRSQGPGGQLQSMYAVDPSLRDLAIPRKRGR